MTDDELGLASVQKSLQGVEQISSAGGQNAAVVAELDRLMATCRARVEGTLQKSETSLVSLTEALRAVELESARLLAEASTKLDQVRAEHKGVQLQHSEVRAESDAALLQLRQLLAVSLPVFTAQLDQARAQVSAAVSASQAATANVSAAAEQLQAELAESRQSLALTREGLVKSAAEALGQYDPMRDELIAQVRSLQQHFESARSDSRCRLTNFLDELQSTSGNTTALVCQRFAQGLADQMSGLALDLGAAVTELRSVTTQPRKTADSEVLTMVQKLRETFDPLQRIEKVFREAHKAELC